MSLTAAMGGTTTRYGFGMNHVEKCANLIYPAQSSFRSLQNPLTLPNAIKPARKRPLLDSRWFVILQDSSTLTVIF